MRLAIAYNLALVGLSCVPDRGPGSLSRAILFPSPGLQNLLHIPAFALLAWLWWRALGRVGAAAGIAVAYGAIDETIQYFVPGRFASVTDFGFDVLGALAAAALIAWRKKSARPAANRHS